MGFLSLLLTALIAVNPLWAETNIAGSQEPDPQSVLRVHVVDDPLPALPNSTSIKGYAVQVTDSSGAPVAEAAVALRLPDEGATGHFAGGLRAWVAYTDAAGLARFPVIEWEGSLGLADLRVTAVKGVSHAGLLLQQRVGPDQPPSLVLPAAVAVASVPSPAPLPVPEMSLPTRQPVAALADVVPLTASNSGAATRQATGHPLTPDSVPTSQTHASAAEPAVSITTSGTGAGSHTGRTWLIIAAVGAAAGVGALLALHGHAASTTASPTGISIGTPTITIGH